LTIAVYYGIFGAVDTEFFKKVEKDHVKRELDVRPGDTVKVHLNITEAGKERVQIFEGIVIAVKGVGLGKTITVRKISYGVGVEKILPINSPTINKIDIVKRGNVRRSKLYYMRGKIGKRSLDVNQEEGFEEILEEETAVAEEPSATEDGKECVKGEPEKGESNEKEIPEKGDLPAKKKEEATESKSAEKPEKSETPKPKEKTRKAEDSKPASGEPAKK